MIWVHVCLILQVRRHCRTRLEYTHAMLRRLRVGSIVLVMITSAGHGGRILVASSCFTWRYVTEALHFAPQLATCSEVVFTLDG